MVWQHRASDEGWWCIEDIGYVPVLALMRYVPVFAFKKWGAGHRDDPFTLYSLLLLSQASLCRHPADQQGRADN